MALTAADRIELHELMARYANAVDVDGREADLYEVFTPDAVLDSSLSGVFKGPEGLKEFARVVDGLRQGRIGRHLITNVRVDGDGDRAEIRAYYLHASTQPGAGHGSTTVNASGHYHCVAVKQDGRWWLKHRTVRVDGT